MVKQIFMLLGCSIFMLSCGGSIDSQDPKKQAVQIQGQGSTSMVDQLNQQRQVVANKLAMLLEEQIRLAGGEPEPEQGNRASYNKIIQKIDQSTQAFFVAREEDRNITRKAVALGINDQIKAEYFLRDKELANDEGLWKLDFQASKALPMVYTNLMRHKDDIEWIVARINETLIFDRNYTIHFRDCGIINAYYNPDEKMVTMCYELIDGIVQKMQVLERAPEDIYDKAILAVEMALLHEIAHGLIDVYGLRYSGKQEDAVDQFAVVFAREVLLQNSTRDASLVMSNLAEGFLYLTDALHNEKLGQLVENARDAGKHSNVDLGIEIFADTHTLTPQRYFDIVCYAIGQDFSPENVNRYVSFDTDTKTYAKGLKMSFSRARLCPVLYRDASNFWYGILQPFMTVKNVQ